MSWKFNTSETEALTTAKRWKKQYYFRNEWKECQGGSQRIYDNLVSLEKPTPKQVEEIVGNDSWTTAYCDFCSESTRAWFETKSNDDYSCATICVECVEGMFEQATRR
jgi:hypothetical protein